MVLVVIAKLADRRLDLRVGPHEVRPNLENRDGLATGLEVHANLVPQMLGHAVVAVVAKPGFGGSKNEGRNGHAPRVADDS